MNKFLDLLSDFGFSRTSVSISVPIVVHAVPGAGKSSLLRKLITEVEDCEVVTHGVPDKPNLTGNYIKPFGKVVSKFNFRVLDEYLSGEFEGFDALLSDPYQNSAEPKKAHYIKETSFRVPRPVCSLLVDLGYCISSTVEGDLVSDRIIGSTPAGVVICLEEEVDQYLRRHSLVPKKACEVRGLEFEVVTLVIFRTLRELVGPDLYIACTRAKKKLVILKSDVAYGAT